MGLLTLARLYLRLRHRAPDIENRTNTSSHTLREPHTQVTGSLVLVSAGTNQCITLLVHCTIAWTLRLSRATLPMPVSTSPAVPTTVERGGAGRRIPQWHRGADWVPPVSTRETSALPEGRKAVTLEGDGRAWGRRVAIAKNDWLTD